LNDARNILPDKIAIFANPIAGRGKGKTLARAIETALGEAGFSVAVCFDRPIVANESAKADLPDAVICIGGDGTLRSVVNHFFAGLRNGPPLLPVPMGTANLMARHLGILQWSAAERVPMVVKTIQRRKIVRLDGGLANGQLFLLMAGVGIDARIVHLLDQMRRGPIDITSYFLPAAMTFASYAFPPLTVSVDGKTLLKNRPAITMISNVKEYGTGFPILPDARPDDGLLDICLMPCEDRRQLIEILVHIAAGEHTTRDDVINVTGRKIAVESREPVPVQIDGDSAGFTPLSVEILPGRVPFLVPV
jgi:diacylglycerol kinase (ATP)